MSTIWDIADSSVCVGLADDFPYSKLLQKVLALRGFDTEETVQNYLFPSLNILHDPFLMKGIDVSAKRILRAIDRREVIMIHGDYDVDGITAAALLVRTLGKLNGRVFSFLPNRKTDGYGVSLNGIRLAKEKDASLFITVDCGISAVNEVSEANKLGMDVIIIDHHQIHDSVPEAYAIINPIQEGCQYPFKELSACGLAFKLSQALLGKAAFELLDLAALSSVCDIAPLIDENRAIVYFGLETLSQRRQLGFKHLCEVAGLKRKKIQASDLGFILGPRINASGRMSSPDNALQLLITQNSSEAEMLASVLDGENKARQKEEQSLLKQAIQLVEREINFAKDRIIVVSGDGWHEGVIGIIAQRLVDHFTRPAVVIAFDGQSGKASGRSMKGFHLFQALEHCEALLEEFGGHELAAGFSIRRENLEAFRRKINEYAQTISADAFCRSVRIDLEISFDELTSQFFHEISLMEPFGAGNPRPVFLTRGVTTKQKPKIESDRFGKDSIRWWVTDGASIFEAIYRTKSQDLYIPVESESYALAYSPKLISREGVESFILEVRDIKPDN